MPRPPEAKTRLLVFTTVFPSAARPVHGVFVRARTLGLPPEIEVRVVAPTPWFPFAHRLRPGWRPAAPRREVQDGLEVEHPRFLSLPGVGKCLDGLFLFLSTAATLRRLHRTFAFDAIDAHFTYPDGFAAVLHGRLFGVPVLITERGTLALLTAYRLRRPQAAWALRRADRVIAVSPSLARIAAGLGLAPERVRVIANGVDAELFRPLDRAEARRALGLDPDGRYVLAVGTLAERKGIDLLIAAVADLAPRFPGLRLLLVGGAGAEGYVGDRLRRQAEALGVADRVVFAGPRPRAELPLWYSAADLLALPSALEGSPNVALEALACGTPVAATATGDLPELLADAARGVLIERRDAAAVT
ncbi:MAG TPA: glycosyltransferase, partial [Thermoanaerobaculia bacterium]|nr:glycosyltransferase [Thermoanaerobaculia bacterium]